MLLVLKPLHCSRCFYAHRPENALKPSRLRALRLRDSVCLRSAIVRLSQAMGGVSSCHPQNRSMHCNWVSHGLLSQCCWVSIPKILENALQQLSVKTLQSWRLKFPSPKYWRMHCNSDSRSLMFVIFPVSIPKILENALQQLAKLIHLEALYSSSNRLFRKSSFCYQLDSFAEVTKTLGRQSRILTCRLVLLRHFAITIPIDLEELFQRCIRVHNVGIAVTIP